MSTNTIGISEHYEREDYAIGNLVEVDIDGRFDGQYVIVFNSDTVLLTLREVTAEGGRGKAFKIGRKYVRVTHLSIPVDLISNNNDEVNCND